MLRRLLGLVLLATALAGCGSSEPSKGQYVDRVNALCRDGLTAERQLTAPSTPQEFGAFLDRIAAINRSVIDRVDAVPKPADDAARIRSEFIVPFRADLTRAQPLVDAVRQAAAGGDLKAVQAAVQGFGTVTDETARENRFLADYGLTDCVTFNGRSGAPPDSGPPEPSTGTAR